MKVLLVDDHALIRDALRGVLKELTDDATVLEAADCHQAMRLIETHPDLHLILLDLSLPDRDGTTAANEIMQPIHDRMPVILPLGHEKEWLPPSHGMVIFPPFPS